MPLPVPARRLRRTLVPALALASALIAVPAAHAAKTSANFQIAVYPADYHSDGITPPITTSTGGYYAYYTVGHYDGAPRVPYFVEQIRGGNVVSNDGGTSYAPGPITVVPGDIFRVINAYTLATVSEVTFSGQPAITASVLGQPTFAGTTNAGATGVTVSLQRRVHRNNTGNSYDGSAPGTGYPTNAFEAVSYGRLTAIGDTTFAGTFGTPIQAGDYISVDQNTDTIVNDNEVTTDFTVVSPAGVVPAKDVVPPKLSSLLFGVKSLSIPAFLKNGLNTFVTPSEPSSVTQTLSYLPPAKKSKKKGKGAKAASSKKAAKAATPIVVATASGSSTLTGQTIALHDTPTKIAKKTLKPLKKATTLVVTTSIKDTAGNTATATTTYKLTAK